jgi:hypothetical protein
MSKRSRKVWIIAVVALIALALLANGLGNELAHGLRRMHGQP